MIGQPQKGEELKISRAPAVLASFANKQILNVARISFSWKIKRAFGATPQCHKINNRSKHMFTRGKTQCMQGHKSSRIKSINNEGILRILLRSPDTGIPALVVKRSLYAKLFLSRKKKHFPRDLRRPLKQRN